MSVEGAGLRRGSAEAPAGGSNAPQLTATASVGDADLALLRAYEPVIRYTKGELFFPTAVAPYVEQCSLWSGRRGERQTLLVPPGELTLERLCMEARRHPDRRLFLRFVQTPLGRAEYLRWRRIPRDRLSATGRFTTTGVFGRLIDAGMRGSLLLRGKVPTGLAAAAESTYRDRLETNRFTYYGRVVRTGGYVCLQYWFFYAMNDWRSTFGGVNDHEADWEMVTVYLAEQPSEAPRPAWVAFSSHDYQGDDLRRRWDDPDLHRAGDHPVVFAGAGSHSGAFIPGDYVVSVDAPQIQPVLRIVRTVRRWLAPWRHYTGEEPGLGIPFVDYARGDGVAIGPAHDAEWSAVLIDDETPWVRDYRGLWGLDTRDRFGGERAPSGPRYEREGVVRTSWANPLGWAGLLKVAPDDQQFLEALRQRVAALERELSDLEETIATAELQLRALRAQARSLDVHDSTRALAEKRKAEVAAREAELNQTIAQRTSLAEEQRVHLATLSEPIPPEPPQAHIRRHHAPQVAGQERRTRFLELWAAISTPLVLASIIVVLVVATPVAWIIEIAVLASLFIAVEAIARRRLFSFLGSMLVLIASVGAAVGLAVLFVHHWRTALAILVGLAAVALLIGNLRDRRR